ncbi:MAG: peptide deformylase, partial [Burkholderiales bacterium]
MALLPILHYPDPRLHKKAASVTQVDDRIRQLIKDLAETMYAAPGIGLAATQVDVHERVIVLDVSEDRTQLHAFVNPVILETEGEAENEEGCLSVPGIFDKVRRAARVKIRALSPEGEPFVL